MEGFFFQTKPAKRLKACRLKVKVPGKYVSTKDTPNDIPQMRHIIYVGQGTGDQNVSFSFDGKTARGRGNTIFSKSCIHVSCTTN